MNWSRGTLRLWIVFAIAWSVIAPLFVARILATQHAQAAVSWDKRGASVYLRELDSGTSDSGSANRRPRKETTTTAQGGKSADEWIDVTDQFYPPKSRREVLAATMDTYSRLAQHERDEASVSRQ